MKKIYLRTMVAVLLLLCSTVASAEDVLIDGINYYIDTNSNTATVITGSEKNTGDINIPAEIVYNGTICSVTAIGSDAFDECRDITSITIPNSVTSIERSAFSHCSGLTNITIPDNVASIGDYAFYYCTGLASITIPKSVTTIGHWAFYSCTGLTSITVEGGNAVYDSRENCNAIIETQTNTLIAGCKNTIIPNSVTTIGDHAFCNCTGLTSVTIPNSVTTIGNYAFKGCYGLTSITIPNSITTIENNVLEYCTSLMNITIPNSVTTIKSAAFWGCESLTSIEIPNSVTIIGSEVFHLCKSLKSITIPNSVTSIGGGLFYKCTDLASITVENGNTVYDSRENCNAIIETQTNTLIAGCKRTIIPNDITKINDYAFWNCTGLTSIKIPGSVTAIGNYAFNGCTGLTSVTIPNSVTTIGDYAFTNCTDLTDVYCHATTVPETRSSAFNHSNATNATLHVPATAIESYRATAPWSYLGTIVAIEGSEENKNLLDLGACGDNLTCAIDTVENKLYINGTGDMYDFDYNNHAPWYNYRGEITSVSINNEVTTIGAYAFDGCYGITSVTIPNSVTTIGDHAFYDCTGLTSVTIPNSVTTIGDYAFGCCTGLTSVTIPNSVTTIGSDAFSYCTGLTSITVEGGNAVYDSRENCNAIVETQTNTLIAGCKSTTIPGSITTIGGSAFCGCTGLTSVTIPNSVTTIGYDAFWGCTGLTSVTIPNSVTTIGDHAFYDCTGLTSVTIPNSVTTIGYEAFRGCTGLTSVTIPNSVTTIGYGAFWCCTGLTSVTIPNSVTTIGDFAFSDCTGLTSVTIPNSVTTIGYWAFYKCTNLTDVYCHATTVPETRSDAFDNSNATNATLHVPATAIESYRATAPWSDFGTIVAIEGSEEDGDEPSITTGEAIDLGLPSGIKWASCNIGATAPEEYGTYFQWDGTDIAQTTLGGNWYMPTKEEGQELIDNCTWTWATRNDINGYIVTGPNGNSIFLPATGWSDNSVGIEGNYWTITPSDIIEGDAYDIQFDINGRIFMDYGAIPSGYQVVRPVYRDGIESIDLGLSVKWASCNIGATAPEEYGGYYAWGETEEKDKYSWSTYRWCNGSGNTLTKYCTDSNYGTVDNKTTLDPEDDVAHVKWGGNWRMPTCAEQDELRGKCQWEWTTYNGVNGYKVTGPNGNSIFLPAAGQYNRPGSTGEYYSSTLDDFSNEDYASFFLSFLGDNIGWGISMRYVGYTVRAVCDYDLDNKPQIIKGEAIDLGLPSGIKWANCNVGATTNDEYGGYYAWGETEEKNYYDWSTYKWCNGSGDTLTKYCTDSNYGTVDNKTTLEPEDDVAHVKWGDNWRMPTLAEQDELREKCQWEWTTHNGAHGYKITGPNGNSIFLPAAGWRYNRDFFGRDSNGRYWSSDLNSYSSESAKEWSFNSNIYYDSSQDRLVGHTVRPVYDDGSSTSIEIITPEVNNENTIYDLRGQKLTEITAPGIYIVNGKKVIVK